MFKIISILCILDTFCSPMCTLCTRSAHEVHTQCTLHTLCILDALQPQNRTIFLVFKYSIRKFNKKTSEMMMVVSETTLEISVNSKNYILVQIRAKCSYLSPEVTLCAHDAHCTLCMHTVYNVCTLCTRDGFIYCLAIHFNSSPLFTRKTL
jgi:hypothetical protein